MFRGNHQAKVDEKGRLKIPSAFKALLDADSITQYFITSADGKSAEIYPLPEWEKIEQKLMKVSALDPAVQQYLNVVNFYGQQVEIDSQGRVLLPHILRSKAKLDGEVNVMGKVKFIDVNNCDFFTTERMPSNGEISAETRQKVAAVLND